MPRGRTSQNSKIDEVRTRFEHWRQAQQGKARIPDKLWSAAMKLAREQGVGRTAATLHLDAGKLKRLMVQAGMLVERPSAPEFVELMATDATGPAEYILELEGRNGKLRILCRGIAVADLVGLSRALCGVAS